VLSHGIDKKVSSILEAEATSLFGLGDGVRHAEAKETPPWRTFAVALSQTVYKVRLGEHSS
jgi:hypothetical protein